MNSRLENNEHKSPDHCTSTKYFHRKVCGVGVGVQCVWVCSVCGCGVCAVWVGVQCVGVVCVHKLCTLPSCYQSSHPPHTHTQIHMYTHTQYISLGR